MTLGKNKKLGKKGHQKKQIDPLSRKEWYDFKAPVPFNAKSFGKTLVTRTTGTKIASDQIQGRVVEQSLADLAQNQDSNSWRKIKLILDEVEGQTAKTSFYGLDITADKLNSMIKKWQSIIECFVDCKSADGYIFRIFVIAFTQRQKGQVKKKSYAKASHVKEIRKKISNYLTSKIAKMSINEIVRNLATMDKLTEDITKECKLIYPLQNVTIRKVKVIKRPKIDAIKMNEMYSHEKEVKYNTGANGDEDEAAQNTLTKSKRTRRPNNGENRERRQRPEGERRQRPEGERRQRHDEERKPQQEEQQQEQAQ